jgi:hypothetical protein
MQLTQSTAEKIIEELGIKNMPLISVRPTYTAVSPDWFSRYKHLCKQFMTSLTDSVETLAFMNLTQDEFMNLIMGKTLPANMSFRFRIPLSWGGELNIDNIFLCRTFPHSYVMDKFIIQQSGNDTIWLPNPAKKIYLPTQSGTSSPGGNGTEDRLTETIASQIASSRDF